MPLVADFMVLARLLACAVDSWVDRGLSYRDRDSVPEPELQKMIEDAERTVAERDGRRYLNDTSVVPSVLWQSEDEETRAFYRYLNRRTEKMGRAFGRL